MRTCGWCLELSVFFLVSFVFYLVSLFFFQPFLMSTSAPNERSMSNPLCDSSLGSVVTSDYVTPLTRPPPKISLRHDHNWTRGNDQLGSTVEQHPVGKLVQQSLGEKRRVLSFPNQPNPNPIQSVIDRGNLRRQNVFSWRKEKRPVHKRSMINVCIKNLALQIEQGNL